VGKFVAWGSFTSFTTDRSVAERFAKPKRRGVGVVFELKTAGQLWIKSLSVHKRGEELLLHPFSALRVDSVDSGVVKLTEVVVAQLASLPQIVTNYMLPTMVPGMRRVDTTAVFARLKAEIEGLSAQLGEERAKAAALKVENTLLRGWRGEADGLRTELATVKSAKATLEKDNRMLRVEVSTLKMEVSTLKSQLRSHQIEV
jgi:hypothetical protein